MTSNELELLLHTLTRGRVNALRGRDAAVLLFGEPGARLWNDVLCDLRLALAIAEKETQ